MDGVEITTATEVTGTEPAGEGLALTMSDGTKREVDHLMFGTGYNVNVSRYPFLSEALLADLKVVDGYPVLRRGFESSIPNLHFLGAPAAWSFGPIMRFVSGSWYGGARLAQAVARERPGGAAHKRRAAVPSRSD